jgi:hypothetical protein
MKLVWKKTGDSIIIENLNNEFNEYCINHWNKNNCNNFFITEPFDINNVLQELKKSLEITNNNLQFFKIYDLNLSISINQDDLNSLHEKWVVLQRKHPMISFLCEKKFKNGKFHFDNVNMKIHELERLFNLILTNNDIKSFTNFFNYNLTSFDAVNVYLKYNNPGRQSYEKWLNFDKSTENIDRNDFNEFYGNVNINLDRAYKKSLPIEYVDWCKKNNIQEYSGDKIVIGNFINLEENLIKYRELFVKNFSVEKNGVMFEL